MRTFKYRDAKSQKFWSIELSGSSTIVRFGRIGTDGQEKTKAFGSPEEAKRAYEKIIAEKVREGYVEIATGTPQKGAAPASGDAPSTLTSETQGEIRDLVRAGFYSEDDLVRIFCEEKYEPGELDEGEVSRAVARETDGMKGPTSGLIGPLLRGTKASSRLKDGGWL